MENYRQRDLDRIFAALSDSTRRAMLARLLQEESLSISALAEPFAMTLPAVIKHLGVLRDAGLIDRTKRGRIVEVRLSPAPLRDASDWFRGYDRFWSLALDRLAVHAETKEAESQSFPIETNDG